MTLEELEQFLPNGLHDAEIRSMRVDCVSRTASNLCKVGSCPRGPLPTC